MKKKLKKSKYRQSNVEQWQIDYLKTGELIRRPEYTFDEWSCAQWGVGEIPMAEAWALVRKQVLRDWDGPPGSKPWGCRFDSP